MVKSVRPSECGDVCRVANAPGHGIGSIGEIQPRVRAVMAAARFHGIALDPGDLTAKPREDAPSAASLCAWARSASLWARGTRLSWRQLMRLPDVGPVVLLFTDGTAGLVTGVNADQNVVFLQDPCASALAVRDVVDELRLKRVWSGEAVLLRPERGPPDADAAFTLRWVAGLVLRERPSLRDIGLASLTLSFLTIFPPLLVMTVVDKVLTHRSYSTLTLLGALLAIATIYEAFLGYARRLIVLVVGTRPDTKLGLHVFNRLLRLRLDYFERDPPARRCIESPRSTRSASSSRAAELMSGNSPPGPRR